MNKLTKVGLSALAGSLAVVSAQASEYSVTGDSQIVYSSAEGNEANSAASNGRGFGVDTDLYFNASGETDNGFSVGFFMALNTDDTITNSSSQVTIGMGSLGTVQFNDVSGSAANGIDDVLPKAYEETWDGTTHARSFDSFGSTTQSGSVDYRTPSFSFGDISVSATYTYDPNAGSGPAAAGGVAANDYSGDAITAKISGMGLTIGGGIEEVNASVVTTGARGTERATGYALYKSGPISIGYQEMFQNTENLGDNTTQAPDVEGDGIGIAFTQDNVSFSYAEVTEEVKDISATTSLETEMTALQATYTMGAMTLGASMYETDNPEGTTGKYEETELSVSFAF